MNYVEKYPGSFKAPCKLVFNHPETENSYAGNYSIDVPENLVNGILRALLGDPDSKEPAEFGYRAVYLSDMRFPKLRDDEGNLVPFKPAIFFKRTKEK